MRRPLDIPFLAAALLSGLLFGIGLALSRMTDPQKIKDFLDFAAIPTGGWDPSLAFVMGGGAAVALIGLRLDRFLSMRTPLVAVEFVHGQRSEIDVPLVAGAAVFGIGWGLSGFCPGPSIAALSLIPEQVWWFVLAMFVGSWVTGEILERQGNGAAVLKAADAGAE